MAKAKKKNSGDAAGTPTTQAAQASQRDDSRQARRDLDDALRAAQAKEAAVALRRARLWLGAISELEELLGDNGWIEGRTTYRVWVHPQSVRDYAKETGDSLEKARDWLEWVEQASLQDTLEAAANRIVLFEKELRWPILATTRRIFGERDHEDNALLAVDDLGQTLKALRVLLDADLAIVRRSQVFRRPAASVESSVLRVLLRASSALSADELAKRLRDGKHGEKLVIDAKGVADAILRLREDCGFKIDNNGKGYRLDNLDRENARAFGFVETPDRTDGT
jgi:hypothetical protein